MSETNNIKEQFNRFKERPLDNLEFMAFQNLAIAKDETIATKYIELLIEIQKIKKDNAVPSESRIV